MEDGGYLKIGAVIGTLVAAITFFGCWIYAIAAYGAFLGIAFGWVPAAFIACVAFGLTLILWPLLALAVLGVVVLISHGPR